MKDTLEKTSSSSLAVVEKKPQRPGGCVGILFQLFDWNRRFATKKLFSKNLLPPVRSKQSSKKFGDDEKQLKLRLTADENNGNFSISTSDVYIEQRQEMRAPGLVARLMGLDSMPALHKDKKSKKIQAACSESHKFVDNVNAYSQTTRVSERQAITRFGREKLPPFKSMLSRSRRHHHPNLPTRVTSPSNNSRRNSSKLIGAATKILETSSRSRCNTSYRHPFSDYVGPSCHGKWGNSVFYQEGSCDDCGSDLQPRVKFESCILMNSSSRYPKPPSFSLKSNNETRNRIQMLQAKRMNNFVSFNQSSNTSTRPRSPVGTENVKFNSRSDPTTPGRKKGPANISTQVEGGTGFITPTANKQKFDFEAKPKSGIQEASERRNADDLRHEGGVIGENASRNSTSMILHELICALSSKKITRCSYSESSNSMSSTRSHAYVMASNPSVEQPLDRERPSPEYALQTYFSCHSSSLDDRLDCIGCEMLNERSRSPNELLSAVVSNNSVKNTSNGLVMNIVDHVSEILNCITFGSKLNKSKEALLNAELILHNAAISDALVGKGCPIKHLLVHELETLASVLWMNFGHSLGVEDGDKEAKQLKEFVLDSVIEYLDERFGKYRGSGSKLWRKLPIRMTTNTLIFEIVETVRKWELSRCDDLDELIEREMRFSFSDRRECETEGSELGSEISRKVLEILVDEIVMDLDLLVMRRLY